MLVIWESVLNYVHSHVGKGQVKHCLIHAHHGGISYWNYDTHQQWNRMTSKTVLGEFYDTKMLKS